MGVNVTLPGLLGNKGLNGNADHEQEEKDPQKVTPAAQPTPHHPAGNTTHTSCTVIVTQFKYNRIRWNGDLQSEDLFLSGGTGSLREHPVTFCNHSPSEESASG